jgi:hypothetical protein
MAYGVILMPPREFDVPSEWYYKLYGVRNYEIRDVTYGIPSIQNFNNIRPSINLLRNSKRRT